jgi:hypothetical protein
VRHSVRIGVKGSSILSIQTRGDVRELANPMHCECTSDGIETRTSHPALADGFGARFPKPKRSRSIRDESAKMPPESAGVDGCLSSSVERGSKPRGGAICRSQAMVAARLPTPKDSVRFAGDLPRGQTQKAAVLPCKQNDRERYPMTPPEAASARGSCSPLVSVRFRFDSGMRLCASVVFNGSTAVFQAARTGSNPVTRTP